MTAPRKRGERTDHSIKRLPDGKGWRARPTLGIDPVTGRQVRPTKVFSTKRAAQDWVTEQRRLWAAASWSSKSGRTFDEVADHWLTLREADVLLWIGRGKSNRDISDILGISPRTVNKHLEQIYEKLGVENRSSAAAIAAKALEQRG